jgi:GYF domain 2/Membrane domain of glycerophosphoryl diester phosphodiesterase
MHYTLRRLRTIFMYRIIGGDKQIYGPVSAEELRRWLAEGRLNPQSQVQAEGSTEWKPLSAYPELQEVLANLPQAPPVTASVAPAVIEPTQFVERDYDLDIGGCVSRGWELYKNNFGVVFGGVAIYVVIQFAFGAFGQIPILGALGSIANLIISGPLIGGVYLVLLRVIRRQPASVGEIFLGFQMRFLQLMLGYIVSALLTGVAAIPGLIPAGFATFMMVRAHEVTAIYLTIGLVGLVIALVPMIYLGVAWVFTLPLVIDKGIDFWPAMSASRKAVTRHWWTVFALLVIMGLINVAGFLCCCVGFFFSFPLSMTAMMYAYEDIFSSRQTQTTQPV